MNDNRLFDVKVAQADPKVRYALALAFTATLSLAGFLLAGTNAQGAVHQSSATVSLRTTALGAILVNSKGRVLYMFARDKSGKSDCAGTCAKYWPPAIATAKPTGGAGIKLSMLGTTKRSDGRKQVTYNHHPLYTFALDKRAGQTNGQGTTAFSGRWWALSGSGRPVTTVATVTTGTTTTTPGTTTTGETTTTSRYP